jgi:large subunit ribosomal protein L1
MKKHGKLYRDSISKVDRIKRYSISEAFELLISLAKKKFDETVDVACRLGIDSSKADQLIRGSIVLPSGTGKSVRIVVFAKGEKQSEAQSAGADVVGGEELIEKVLNGWMEFDRVIATPDMMSSVSKLGKTLGPRGLMPNPKMGTVTFDVAQAVKDQKAGKVEFRADKDGNLHSILGKISFGKEKLEKNFKEFIDSILKAKPSTVKGTYLRSVSVSTTMGPGIKIDTKTVSE